MKRTGAGANGPSQTCALLRGSQSLGVAFWQHFAGYGSACAIKSWDNGLSGWGRSVRIVGGAFPSFSGLAILALPVVLHRLATATFARFRAVPTLTIGLHVAVLPAGWARAIAVSLGLAAGMAVLVVARRAIQQTTLRSAWWWTLAAVASWGLLELRFAWRGEANLTGAASALRLMAMALCFCPTVALLGAKRPQDRAWNFVVLSLWGVLALPAIETYLLQPGRPPSFGDARAWFLWAPIGLTLVSYGGTRYWPSSVLAAIGQVIAFSPYLALIMRPLVRDSSLVGFGCVSLALVVAWGLSFGRRRAESELDRQWLDFRDGFGMFWALRVQERMNATAAEQGWDCVLGWEGFRAQTAAGEQLRPDFATRNVSPQATLRGLLRRFVSAEWLAARSETRPPRGDEHEAAEQA